MNPTHVMPVRTQRESGPRIMSGTQYPVKRTITESLLCAYSPAVNSGFLVAGAALMLPAVGAT